MQLSNDLHDMSIGEVISRITKFNDDLRGFWRAAHGWAPADAAVLLARARLDRQTSLSACLVLWETEPAELQRREGSLILGWANLGALVEGTMKWLLSVYRENYPEDDPVVLTGRNQELIEPDALSFEKLRQVFDRYVWIESEREGFNSWLKKVQKHRNAIHSYEHRDIGDLAALHQAIREYLEFLRELHSRTPGYPDEAPDPYESIDDLR